MIETAAKELEIPVSGRGNPAIQLQELVVGRADLPLTPPLVTRFEAGSIWQITGPNGSGKTSLLRVLAGLLPALSGCVTQSWITHESAGDATAAANTIRPFDPEWQCQIAWHPVQPVLKPGPSIRQMMERHRPPAGRLVEDALNRWGLDHLTQQPVQYLSAGQRKRLDLAQRLLNPRPIWLLDEPTVTLDTQARETLGAMLAEHRDRGGLAIIASHDALPVPGTLKTLALATAPIAPGGEYYADDMAEVV